jgi:DNA repair exonuclease SbcCD ATPase subunit
MTPIVQMFTCPRCNRGEFRSLPGDDGKAYCPWCGDMVTGGVATPPPAPAASAPETPVAPGAPVDGAARTAAEGDVPALRARAEALDRMYEQVKSELRQELDKKELIKKAVMEEVGRLGAQLGEAKALLERKDEEHRSALADLNRLKEDLEKEREKAAELSKARGNIDEMGKSLFIVESELEERRKSSRELEEGRDTARREVDQLRSDLTKTKTTSESELVGLQKKLAACEARLEALKGTETDVNDLKVRLLELRRRLETERAEFQAKTAAQQAELEKKTAAHKSELEKKAGAHQAELEKRDQRIRELQLLIKTLGERLNDLAGRRFI